MMGREFGNLPLFYLGGVGGTLALLELARFAFRWRRLTAAAAFLGRESLMILIFHLLGIRVLSAIISVAVPNEAEELRQSLWWCYVPFAIAFSLAAAAVIRRVPWLARIYYPDAVRAAPFPPRPEPATSS
jgi:fucose 4-O-acetylase-like acetyltransferase